MKQLYDKKCPYVVDDFYFCDRPNFNIVCLITSVHGESIEELQNKGVVSCQQSNKYMKQVKSDLINQYGFKHHDLHPRNVLLDIDSGKLKVIDTEVFGSDVSESDTDDINPPSNKRRRLNKNFV